MLTPETRVLLTDALRPPDGYRVDVAVATTYSLDLTALLLAALSFAVFDREHGDDQDQVDPIRLLEAVRRHGEHTTVFCQAGSIHVPSAYRRMLTFVEDSVHEVMAPTDERVFHPKIWAIRYANNDGQTLHRLLCMSRNLTFDRSWDTALRLDESPTGDQAADGEPVAALLEALPGLCIRSVPADRREQVESLAKSFAAARFAPPEPFDKIRFIPLGVDGSDWPFPDRVDHLLAITPFATKGELARLGQAVDAKRQLVSRPETLDRLGGIAVDGWNPSTLQRAAEVPEGEDVKMATPAMNEWDRVPDGLHAKTFVCDVGDRAVVLTGSANLTGAAFGGNVEFDVVLEGPISTCGVAAVLHGPKEAPGLAPLLEPYSVDDPDGTDDAAQELGWRLVLLHQQLAASEPIVHVTQIDESTVTLRLDLASPESEVTTHVRPISLPERRAQMLADGPPEWASVSRETITPFVAIDSVLGEGAARARRHCVIACRLAGDIGDRRRETMRHILRSKDDVLRYLVFLLGDPSYETLLEATDGAAERRYGEGTGGAVTDVALLEPLVRAAGRDEDALARVASLIREIDAMPKGSSELMPEGVRELWDIVWEAHQQGVRS